jgi:hypothetical protein
MEIRAVSLLVRNSRLKHDMSHGAVDGDRDGWLGGVAREYNHVLMERYMATGTTRGSSTRDAGSNTSSVRGHD